MWFRDCQIIMRDPASFKMLNINVIENYQIGRRLEDEQDFSPHEPETMTEDEVLEKLNEVGTVVRIENYICSDTGFEIFRGYIKKADGKLYNFVIYKYCGKFIKTIVNHTISCLAYSGREPNVE